MLKFSTKTSYALRACVEMGRAHGEGPVSVTTIATSADIPKRYLEQILQRLRKAKIIESTRGINGGYSLMVEPQELSVSRVVQAIEGELDGILCAFPENRGLDCHSEDGCASQELCSSLTKSLGEILETTVIETLIRNPKILNVTACAEINEAHALPKFTPFQ